MSEKKDLNIVSWNEMGTQEKVLLLKFFNIERDTEGYVVQNGERVIDKYINISIKYDNIALMPGDLGKPVIIDDNPLSISLYLEEYGY